MSQRQVRETAYRKHVGAVEGRGVCGMDSGFRVGAFAEGAVSLSRPILLNCPQVAEVERWIAESVQPAAQARFGQPVVALVQTGGYSCRQMTGSRTGKLSEHAFGNAIDVGGFKLADGRVVTVKRSWSSYDEQERAFLRDALADGCESFTTALGPGAPNHADHFHLDLANHGRTSQGGKRYCNPKPPPERAPLPTMKGRDELPDAEEFEQDASADPGATGGARALALSAPPLPASRRAPVADEAEPLDPLGQIDPLAQFDPETTSSIRRARAASRKRTP